MTIKEALITVAAVVAIGILIYRSTQCESWIDDPGGRMDCHTSGSYTSCSPRQVCEKWKD